VIEKVGALPRHRAEQINMSQDEAIITTAATTTIIIPATPRISGCAPKDSGIRIKLESNKILIHPGF